MWTGVYFPQNGWDEYPTPIVYLPGDASSGMNNFHWNEGPSYSVRLLVFEMPED